MVTVNALLVALFVSGALANCTTQPSLFITAPNKMEALTGSCLQIPCNFTSVGEPIFDSTVNTFAVWIKNDPKFQKNPRNVIFNSSGTLATYPMRVTGNPREKDCTTLFSNLTTGYTDSYFFRVENGGFKATASCDPLQITVKDSPPSPTVEIPGDLKEGQSVTITCSASTPCPHSPPELTWTLQQDSRSTTEENTDGTLTTKIQQTITLSDTHDGSIITCSARYPVNEGKDVRTAETEVTLSVSYAPKTTSASISPTGWVPAGTWVNLTCSSRAKPPVSRFTWFKSSTDGPVKVSEGAFYSFNATDGGVYYCVAINDLGNQASSVIHLTIAGTEQPLTWGPVVGGITGVIILIAVVSILWRLKSSHPTSHQTQRPVLEEPGRTRENEDIHYGEIDFSKLRPEPPSQPVQGCTEQQDTVYSQVKVCKTENRSTHTDPESLYAKVKKS